MTNGNALPDVIIGRGLREKTVVSVVNGDEGVRRVITGVKGRGEEGGRLGEARGRGEVTSGGELYN